MLAFEIEKGSFKINSRRKKNSVYLYIRTFVHLYVVHVPLYLYMYLYRYSVVQVYT